MLDASLKEQLASALAHLKSDLRLSYQLDDSKESAEVRGLLTDIAEASSRVQLAPGEAKADKSFAIAKPDEEARVFFSGLPLGHEFTSLVLALLHVSGHPPRISDEQLEEVRSLSGEYHFETFFSQSCQNCPDVVQALNILAALNPSVSHRAIDGGFFPEEVEARQIMAVPTVYLNGEFFASGKMELAEIVAKLDKDADKRRASALSQKEAFDVLVVGGGPAGAAAAIYSARKGVRTGVVADRFGGQVLDTLSIENFISVSATEGPALASALEAHVRDYPVDIMKNQRVARLVPASAASSNYHEVELENGARLQAKSLILATGARFRDMGVPGEQEYRNKGVTYCPHCDGPLFKGKDVAVIGGGNAGVEAAIDLANIVKSVTLLEFASELKADEVLQNKLRQLPNVSVIVDARTTEVVGDGQRLTSLKYEDRKTGEAKELALAGIFVQIGLLPNTTFAKDALELTKMGEIVVDKKGATSVPGVFAAGDATNVPFKQIIIATGEGAKAALGAFEYLMLAPAFQQSA